MGECFLNDIFITVITVLWKLKSPLESAIAFWKLKGLFAIKRSVERARVQCICKTSVVLGNVLDIVFIKELRA